MAKLVFNYASMNSGKSTRLLQVAYSYTSSGKSALCLVPDIGARFGESKGVIRSRIGIETEAMVIDHTKSIESMADWTKIDVVLVDEVQFLTRKQIEELTNIVDDHNTTVLAYGLRNDFQGKLFEGTQALFEYADVFEEIQGVCSHSNCSRRSTHVLRINENGDVIKSGEQVSIGAEEQYRSVCRKHYKANEFE